jgi:hypothetical protein
LPILPLDCRTPDLGTAISRKSTEVCIATHQY